MDVRWTDRTGSGRRPHRDSFSQLVHVLIKGPQWMILWPSVNRASVCLLGGLAAGAGSVWHYLLRPSLAAQILCCRPRRLWPGRPWEAALESSHRLLSVTWGSSLNWSVWLCLFLSRFDHPNFLIHIDAWIPFFVFSPQMRLNAPLPLTQRNFMVIKQWGSLFSSSLISQRSQGEGGAAAITAH